MNAYIKPISEIQAEVADQKALIDEVNAKIRSGDLKEERQAMSLLAAVGTDLKQDAFALGRMKFLKEFNPAAAFCEYVARFRLPENNADILALANGKVPQVTAPQIAKK